MIKFKNTYERFLKYLKNEFSNTQRHDFEKSVESDEFEKEALEGLEIIGSAALEKDIKLLNKKIENKISVVNNTSKFYKITGIAASLTLILGLGAFLFLKKKEAANEIVYDINNEELPSVKLEKKKDTVHTEIVFEEAEIIEETPDQDLKTEKPKPSIPEPEHSNNKAKPVINSETEDSVEETIVKVESSQTTGLASKKANSKINTAFEKPIEKIETIDHVISGVVLSIDKSLLANTNVSVKGSNTTAISDKNGRYTINAKPDDTLEFYNTRFEKKEVVAAKNLNVVLKEKETIEQVAIVDYNAEKDIRKQKTASPDVFLNKSKKRVKRKKVRKFRLGRLRRAKGVKSKINKQYSVKAESNKEVDTTKTSNTNPPSTIEEFSKWFDMQLNESLFEPGKIYYVEASFEINSAEEVSDLKFHSNNNATIQNELIRVFYSIPNWALDIFKEEDERVFLELEIFF